MLPDDRADVLYHRYDGGGVTIDGPSLLLRKKFAEKYSVSANYYMDMVSSASIDVMTTASPYKEERTQGSLAFDMLQGKTQYSVSYTLSDESDYTANTASFDLSQDLFGDLTTVSFGFSQGWDEVRKNGDNAFEETVDRRNYRFGLQQILTPRLMAGPQLRGDHRRGVPQQPVSLGALPRRRPARAASRSSPRCTRTPAPATPSR